MAKAMVKKKPEQPTEKKKPAQAMVKPKPEQPLEINLAVEKKVGEYLNMYGIFKPFVVIEARKDRWVVHLFGEDKPRVLTIKDGKPELT